MHPLSSGERIREGKRGQMLGLGRCLLDGAEVRGAWGDAEYVGDPDPLIFSY